MHKSLKRWKFVKSNIKMSNKSLNTEIILTEDGSSSLFVPELNEQYHSRFGAITESLHIYIGYGLNALHSNAISIFELGFGTGLNAFLTLTKANSSQMRIHYDTIELYPLPLSITNYLDYPARIEGSDPNVYRKLHEAEWGKETEISPLFTIKKLLQDFSEYIFERNYDLIYFDAFAPSVQPELWTQERFNKISEAMAPGAILVTYSAMGDVRRRLISAGLEVKRLPGPPGKREILQAHKP
jgi:tRNA U34 5-methylaminomethyl-2-thiouridine-forming methyltransferase MnmC